ncbi:thiazole synthase [Leeia sp. TBRC 13508]|uniref:Thiazole synthase n=1 Tax=Leeia speluncae TaxID=2884804 RepID=A0ABS8D7U3_9NEIS|nr:thiazole synthase [Leeia speluncae]MCB6184236.1 thiazole synthase [Leeia speluncae]
MNTLAKDEFVVYGQVLKSRMLLGTARYQSPKQLADAVTAAQPGMLTVSVRRQQLAGGEEGQPFWQLIQAMDIPVLPNTAGCHSVQEAITTSEMARELFETNLIKLEVIGDDETLQPDPYGLVEAAEYLVKQGFHVLPYCTDDLVLCRRLLDVGCEVLMPWAAPIGTGQGPRNPEALQTLRERFTDVPLIVDAGLGLPSHATQVMEWGFDGVLLNTAVARAVDPVKMAGAFAAATQAGRDAWMAGPMPVQRAAAPSTPVLGTPFWHQQSLEEVRAWP